MSEEMTLKDLQSNFMDLNSGMQELQKAMQTTMNANAVMPVEWILNSRKEYHYKPHIWNS